MVKNMHADKVNSLSKNLGRAKWELSVVIQAATQYHIIFKVNFFVIPLHHDKHIKFQAHELLVEKTLTKFSSIQNIAYVHCTCMQKLHVHIISSLLVCAQCILVEKVGESRGVIFITILIKSSWTSRTQKTAATPLMRFVLSLCNKSSYSR